MKLLGEFLASSFQKGHIRLTVNHQIIFQIKDHLFFDLRGIPRFKLFLFRQKHVFGIIERDVRKTPNIILMV